MITPSKGVTRGTILFRESDGALIRLRKQTHGVWLCDQWYLMKAGYSEGLEFTIEEIKKLSPLKECRLKAARKTFRVDMLNYQVSRVAA